MATPSSTYRIQLNQSFTFHQLDGILDYLDELGVSAVYAAPILKADPGSTHGYDVIDPHVINPEIGSLDDLKKLTARLKEKDMIWVQDIVPNHMAFSQHNQRLVDVLERGIDSPYYNYFDIDWDHHLPELKGKLMLPILGKELEECIHGDEIKIELNKDGLFVNYFDSNYPVSIQSYKNLQQIIAKDGNKETEERILKFMETSQSIKHLSEWLVFKNNWFRESESKSQVQSALASSINILNADHELLKEFLNGQNYALSYWKNTEKFINYRRFFTVNSLICLRMESDEVFKEYHGFIHSLYAAGIIQGLRIDHIDGISDPSQYIRHLRKLFGKECYIIAEKILEAKEEMPEHWPLEGTSGYEFLSIINQLFTDRKGAKELVNFYQTLLPEIPDYDTLVNQNKKLILEEHMAGELDNMVNYFFKLDLQQDHTYERIKGALALIMLALPVYRIYPDKLPLQGTNQKLILETFETVRRGNHHYEDEVHYLSQLFLGEQAHSDRSKSIVLFLKRMMQFTGPLTAKGVEDTTFYIYNPLISHEEVGAAPSTLSISIQTFHKRMIKRQQDTPLSLNATATHDTKRGEDARIRLNILSEIPHEWIAHVTHWFKINKSFRTIIDGEESPSVNDEYFIYQAMVGGFPEDFIASDNWIERLQEYIIKVVREAKVISSWSTPHETYESACVDFIKRICGRETPFMKDFTPFIKKITDDAWVYSVAQALIKITAPGIPDIYQGCELYDLSFVDPDNRRAVDYEQRRHLLNELKRKEQEGAETLFPWIVENAPIGVGKLFITYKLLQFRKAHSDLFAFGEYIPLSVNNTVLGFVRHLNNEWLMVVIPFETVIKNRASKSDLDDIFISLPENFPEVWENILTAETLTAKTSFSVGTLLNLFPVAVLKSGFNN